MAMLFHRLIFAEGMITAMFLPVAYLSMLVNLTQSMQFPSPPWSR